MLARTREDDRKANGGWSRSDRDGSEIAGASSLLYSRTRARRPMRPFTLSLSPSGGEGIETTPSPSARERVGVRVAQVFTHSPV